MAISPIDPMPSLGNTKEVKKKVDSSEENTSQNVSDKVELSSEAKKLHEVQMQNRLSDIRGKVESGFYNSDEVLNSVANSLVKVIQSK
ncbi:MAG: hypothetical protein M1469_09490 [Bacteroidetes bacterium]|nr:hypothetical protein [Bacteroidota bacterium]MCL5268320.1 hypothetical protein [Bacteroidota bacterium]